MAWTDDDWANAVDRANRALSRADGQIAALRTKCDRLQEQLRLSIVDAANNEAEVNDLRAALEGCVEAGKVVEHFCVRVVGDPDHGCELCKALAAAREALGGQP